MATEAHIVKSYERYAYGVVMDGGHTLHVPNHTPPRARVRGLLAIHDHFDIVSIACRSFIERPNAG